ncbi:MAG: hypothetical protein OEX97_01780, partial [Acidimicrobiia bacterium]|nr:hypothetical protein [Acidimicrobiia bacterium]
MPPRLPDRYHFEVRLGRDGDIEEWLATDTALDRPVLIRIVGPETTLERRTEFLAAVRGAAGVTHTHLASIFAADQLPDGAYSVSEWAGGLTLNNRREAGETMPVQEFLPNAAGLADALAALHARGVLHGSIDQSSIFFSMAHPAKLAAIGRHSEGMTASRDVRDLSNALATAVTGSLSYDVPPSQMVDGIAPGVDRILQRARSGDLDAEGLAELLRAAPSSMIPQETPDRSLSWRVIVPTITLLAVAVILFAVGRSLNPEPQDPLLFPVAQQPPPVGTSTTSTTAPTSTDPSDVSIVAIRVFDPEGDGREHDAEIPNLTDGDPTTSWNTERYDDPLPLVKGGVGLILEVAGIPTDVELLGAANGMSYRLLWRDVSSPDIDAWEPIGS